ncbi:hypothetical protein [Candidatus Lokiarchaeum ossiferum]|uniref:hypothetical protein n=1 Tax=Candidatus Lokiarchaeum ossiferum TaxID=2951803 RepID=UPI00352FD359
MGKQLIMESGIELSANQKKTFVLPNEPISKLIIKMVGSHSGGTGTYVANTFLQSIRIKLNGREFEHWGGENPSGEVPYGIAAMREFNKVDNRIADPNNRWVLKWPDALPENLPKTLEIQANSLAGMGYSVAPTMPTLEISYETEDILPDRVVVRKNLWNKRVMTAKSKDSFYLEGLDDGFSAASIAFHLVDAAVEITQSTGVNFELEIFQGADQLFAGTYADLMADHQSAAGIAPTAGWAVLPLNLRKFSANQVRIKYTNLDTSTYDEMALHYYLLELAEV